MAELAFEFRVGERPESAHFELSNCRSPKDVPEQIESAIAQLAPGAVLSVVLALPARRARGQEDLSSSRAFNVLVQLLERAGGPRSVRVFVDTPEAIEHFYRYLPASQRPSRSLVRGRLGVEFMMTNLLELRVDAIVNAANAKLKLGGGVSDAICRAAPTLQGVLDSYLPHHELKAGDVVLTQSCGLPCTNHIVHAVCLPAEGDVLRRAVSGALALCDEQRFQSVAFPALGTGTGHMPIGDFVDGFCESIDRHLEDAPTGSLRRVVVAMWEKHHYDLMIARLDELGR